MTFMRSGSICLLLLPNRLLTLSSFQQIASLFESTHTQSNVYNPKNKWSCPSCTYLNWPKANKCTQCQKRRSSSPPFNLQDGLVGRTDHIRSPKLKSKDHPLHHAAVDHHHRRSENHTFPLIPSWTPNPDLRSLTGDESDSDYYYNDRNRIGSSGGGIGHGNMERRTSFSSSTRPPPPSASSTSVATTTTSSPGSNLSVQKWPCSVCTYVNWPRATKCNMCQTRRRRSSFSRTSETDAITDNLSLMRLTAASTTVLDNAGDSSSSRAEASGGILIDSLSGFSSDSEEAEDEDGVGGHIAFKQRRKRE